MNAGWKKGAEHFSKRAEAAAAPLVAPARPSQRHEGSQVNTMVGWLEGTTSRSRYSSAAGLSSALQSVYRSSSK